MLQGSGKSVRDVMYCLQLRAPIGMSVGVLACSRQKHARGRICIQLGICKRVHAVMPDVKLYAAVDECVGMLASS
jgi:hypothetical protein